MIARPFYVGKGFWGIRFVAGNAGGWVGLAAGKCRALRMRVWCPRGGGGRLLTLVNPWRYLRPSILWKYLRLFPAPCYDWASCSRRTFPYQITSRLCSPAGSAQGGSQGRPHVILSTLCVPAGLHVGRPVCVAAGICGPAARRLRARKRPMAQHRHPPQVARRC